MESLETLSDCSDSSHTSGCLSSNLSTLSGLSDYQDEFLELGHSINPKKYCKSIEHPKSTRSNQSQSISHYESRIETLTDQLKTILKENEKYKNDLFNLERKVELACHEKIETLLARNNQLELLLATANKQIDRLIKHYQTNTQNSLIKTPEHKVLQLEKENHDLHVKNKLSFEEIVYCKHHKEESEALNQSLKVEIENLKIVLQAKENCVIELKGKIAEQHGDIQKQTQSNLILSHKVEKIKSELCSVTKSECWYKEQLLHCQNEKKCVIEELAQYRQGKINQQIKIENISIELNMWKYRCEEIQLGALKEKESLLKRLEENHPEVVQHITSAPVAFNFDKDVKDLRNYYEFTISDLTDKIVRIQSCVEEGKINFEKLLKDKTDILAKYLHLQKLTQQKDFEIETLENNAKHFELKFTAIVDNQTVYQNEILDLKNKLSSLEIELSTKNHERALIEATIKTVQDQFKTFKQSYEILQNELHNKSKVILQLQVDKQELFMNNNWKICELESSRQKDIQIRQLKEKLKDGELLHNKIARFTEMLDQTRADNEKYRIDLDHYRELIKEKDDFIRRILKSGTLNNVNSTRQVPMNNYADLAHFDNSNIIQMLEHTCKLFGPENIDSICNTAIHIQCNNASNKSEYISTLLRQIQTGKQVQDNEVLTLKRNANKLRDEVIHKLGILESRCEGLRTKCNQNENLIKELLISKSDNTIGQTLDEKVKILQALLQVKAREQKDKQKRYEANYRTLLRKVKEHMKGRNASEKHNVYLQDLYNSLFDECNTLKLQLSSKQCAIQNLQSNNDKYTGTIEKLKLTVLNLEKQLPDVDEHPCKKCVELEAVRGRLSEVEDTLTDVVESRNFYKENLSAKEEVILTLNKTNQKLLFDNSDIVNRYNISNATIAECKQRTDDLTDKLRTTEKEIVRLNEINVSNNAKLLQERENCAKFCCEKENLLKKLNDVNQKEEYLSREIQLMNANFRQKCEELEEVKAQSTKVESNWARKHVDLENLITALKSQLQLARNDSEKAKNEKFFLQRLCNDLKGALRIHVNQNKVLQNQIKCLHKEKQEFSSLPATVLPDLPSQNKYDDVYINRLLQENMTPLQDKPFSDIQGCLDTLKNEIVVLQKQITEKHIHA